MIVFDRMPINVCLGMLAFLFTCRVKYIQSFLQYTKYGKWEPTENMYIVLYCAKMPLTIIVLFYERSTDYLMKNENAIIIKILLVFNILFL